MKRKNVSILAAVVTSLLFSISAFASDAGVSAAMRGPGEGEVPAPGYGEMPAPGYGGGHNNCYFAYHIRKVGPHYAKKDKDIHYRIFVKNIGNCRLRDVSVKDLLPRHTEFVWASPKPDYVHDRKVVWKDIDLRVGEREEFDVKVKVKHEERRPHHDFRITNVGCAFTRYIGIRICDQATTQIHDDHGPWSEDAQENVPQLNDANMDLSELD